MKKTLLELLKAELVGETAPEGWYTIAQLMQKTSAGRKSIENFVVRKKFEMRKFRTQTNDNKSLNANHYYIGKL